jgi:hypothetical protein
MNLRMDAPLKYRAKSSVLQRKLRALFGFAPLTIIGAIPVAEGGLDLHRNRGGQGVLLLSAGLAFETLVVLLWKFQISGPRG